MNQEALGLGSLKGQQPEDSGGFGEGDQKGLILHQPGRRRGEEARELLAHRTDKVGAGYAGAGRDLGRGETRTYSLLILVV